MSTDPKRYSASWLYGTLLLGAAFGAILYAFLKGDPCEGCCPPPPEPPTLTMTGFFDRENVERLTKAPGATGARFYLAKDAAGAVSVLTGPIKEGGAHVPYAGDALEFRMFKGISGSATDMTVLNESDAEATVKRAGTTDRPTWSVDVSADVLTRLIGTDGANAVGFLARPTSSKDWSFELAPVSLREGRAYAAGTPGDVVLGAYPCPRHCPAEPALCLHMR